LENDFIIQKPFNDGLQQWVDYYFFIEIPVDKLKFNEEFVFPFPRITFGYFFEHPFLVTNHSLNENYSAEMIISRISTNQISVKPLTDKVKIIGAHLKPYGLGLLTNDDISKKPWIIKTEDLFKMEAERFKKKIDRCSNPKEMFAVIEHIFLSSVLTKDLSIVIKALDLIKEEEGNISISKLSENTGTSTRTLRNHFYKSVGCSPKEYMMLLKLRQSIYQMKHSFNSLTSVSYSQNFADQAHFSNTVKNITGTHPRAIKKNLPNFRFLQF